MKLPGLSLFFPYLNDGGSISWLLSRARAAAGEVAERFEIIVIDDGSRREQAGRLDEAAAAVPEARVVRHPSNLGYGAVVRRGIAEAAFEWIFYTDGDGQYDPADLRLLHERWRVDPGLDLVNGHKVKRSDSLHRVVLGEMYRRLTRRLFCLPIRDVNCDFRLMRAESVRGLGLGCIGGGIGLELVRLAAGRGARFGEAPVSHLPRRHGRSEFFNARGLRRLGRELVGQCAQALGSNGRRAC